MNVNFRIRKKTGRARVSLVYSLRGGVNNTYATPIELPAEHWDDKNKCYDRNYLKKSPKMDVERKMNEKIISINRSLEDLTEDINEFERKQNYKVTDQDFRNFLDAKFKKNDLDKMGKKENVIPEKLCDFIDYLIEEKSQDIVGVQRKISHNTVRAYNTIKGYFYKFNKNLKISDIDDEFRKKYNSYMIKQKYSSETIRNSLKKLKYFVEYAFGKDIPVSKSVLNWRFYEIEKEYDEQTLTIEEINKISNLELNGINDRVRDWFIIHLHTGVRISDLLKMNSEMIKNDYFIEFQSKKVKRKLIIPMSDTVLKILDKRHGEFPKCVAHATYNRKMKEICKLAGMNEIVVGGKPIKGSENKKVVGNYHKWELIKSHTCRRTFVTLFRPHLGSKLVQNNTGHTTEKMLEVYDYNPQSMDTAMELRVKMNELLLNMNK